MTVKRMLAGLSLALLALQAGAGAQGQGAYRQKLGSGQINWTEQYIEVVGQGVAPASGNPAQQKLMAKRAATADAYRKLLELVQGVQVTAETTVRNYVTESDIVKTRVEGVVKGAQPLGEPRVSADGVYELTVRMPLYGQFASAIGLDKVVAQQQQQVPHSLRPGLPTALSGLGLAGDPFLLARCQRFESPQPVETTETTETPEPEATQPETTEPEHVQPEYTEPETTEPVYEPTPAPEVSEPGGASLQAENPDQPFTGLVIDARGLGMGASMSPRVASEASQVYVGNFALDIDRVIAEGIVLYYGSLEEALASERAGSHPLVVRPVDTDRHRVNFVLNPQDAEQIQAFDERDRFLQNLQVVAVLD